MYAFAQEYEFDIKLNRILGAFEDNGNVAEFLKEDERDYVARTVIENFNKDVDSRRQWDEDMKGAMQLALQVAEKKDYPFVDASNVKFPLITIACLQFNARTYPAMLNGTDIVRHRVVGADPAGEKARRAERVSKHMSYQLLEQDAGWEEEFDKLLMALPIMGCGFKKSYFCPIRGHNVSVNVFPKDLYMDYASRSVEDAWRKTHVIELRQNHIIERQRMGMYLDADLGMPTIDYSADNNTGIVPAPFDMHAPYKILEQHCWIDLDGDGYQEPYVVTVDLHSEKLLRIFPRFAKENIKYGTGSKVVSIDPIEYFTQYLFYPSPDGGAYGLGFGKLLGPITESINTAINQLLDAGHRSNMQSGFIGRGARLKNGNYKFRPGEWIPINAPGDDIRKNIIPLPIKEPSQTLFALIGFLVEYAERVSSVSDIMVGKTPGQNTPATTAMAALDQGMKVFNAIYKRLYKGLTKEFRKLYNLNKLYLNPVEYFEIIEGSSERIFQKDYHGDPTDIKPSADPAVSSDTQRLMKAEALRNASRSSGMYDLYQVERRYLDALQISGIDEVLPPPGSPNAPKPQIDPKIQIEQSKFQLDAQIKQAKLRAEVQLLQAQIQKMEADALAAIAKAEATEQGAQVEQYRAFLDGLQQRRESIRETLDATQAIFGGRVQSMGGSPDDDNGQELSESDIQDDEGGLGGNDTAGDRYPAV